MLYTIVIYCPTTHSLAVTERSTWHRLKMVQKVQTINVNRQTWKWYQLLPILKYHLIIAKNSWVLKTTTNPGPHQALLGRPRRPPVHPRSAKKNQWFIAYLNWIQKKKQTIKTPTLQPTYFVLRKDDLQMSWWYTTPTNQLIFTSRAAYPKSFGGLAPISLQLAHSHLKRSEGYKGCGGQLLAWQSCWLPSDCFKAPKIKAQLGLIFWLLELLCSNISITR